MLQLSYMQLLCGPARRCYNWVTCNSSAVLVRHQRHVSIVSVILAQPQQQQCISMVNMNPTVAQLCHGVRPHGHNWPRWLSRYIYHSNLIVSVGCPSCELRIVSSHITWCMFGMWDQSLPEKPNALFKGCSSFISRVNALQSKAISVEDGNSCQSKNFEGWSIFKAWTGTYKVWLSTVQVEHSNKAFESAPIVILFWNRPLPMANKPPEMTLRISGQGVLMYWWIPCITHCWFQLCIALPMFACALCIANIHCGAVLLTFSLFFLKIDLPGRETQCKRNQWRLCRCGH